MQIQKLLLGPLLITLLTVVTVSKAASEHGLPHFEEGDFDGLFESLIPSEEKQAALKKLSIRNCDRLAGHPWDKDAELPGVTWGNMDGPKAVSECEKALEADRNNRRIMFQLARAYDKVGNPKAFELLGLAAGFQEYPAAYYHYGSLYEDGLYTEKNIQNAFDAYVKGSALGHVPSTYAVGRLRLEYAKSSSDKEKALDEIRFAANKNYQFAIKFLEYLQ